MARRLGWCLSAMMFFIGTMATSNAGAQSQEVTIAQQLAVPSYIHPGVDAEAWSRLIGSTPGTVGIGVANVVNGPDYLPFENWSSVIRGAQAAGIRMIGYVDTGYLGTTGQKTRLGSSAVADWLSQIQQDVNAWYAFYGPELRGIFFDQVQNACGPGDQSSEWADLYRGLSEYVKRNHPGALTVGNPGIVVPQCYESSADVLITFEGSYESYLDGRYTPLSWDPVDPRKIWHIIYGASQEQMEDAIALSKSRDAGYVFVTDDVLANPYDTLPAPAYWASEQVLIAPGGSPSSEPPSVPVDLAVSSTTSTSATIEWSGSSASSAPLVGYDVFRDGLLVGSVRGDSTTYTATTLSPSTSYNFAVAARDAAGNVSPPSQTLEVRTGQAGWQPLSPPRLTVSATSLTSATLGWKVGAPYGSRSTGWPQRYAGEGAVIDVYRNDRRVLRLPATVTSVVVGGLAPGSSYTFTVRAVTRSGSESLPSSPVIVTTTAAPDGQLIQAPIIMESSEVLTYSADFLVPFAFRRVFIVTGNPDNACWWTGSTPQLCADFVIENERLLKYEGTGGDWKWQVVQSVQPSIAGFTYSWSISPADLGSVASIDAVFNANGYAPNTYCGPSVICASTGPPIPYEILTDAGVDMIGMTEEAPEMTSAVTSSEAEGD